MNKDAEIERILIDLTNAFDYDNENEAHKDAYIVAYDKLCSLIGKLKTNKKERK